MRPSMRLLSLGFAWMVAGVMTLGAPTEPAAAAPFLPIGLIQLTIHEGTSSVGDVLEQVDLMCGPEGGPHPKRAEACEALKSVDGDLHLLPGRDGACTRIYQPVTAVAAGLWKGSRMGFERSFGNRCELANALAPVFDF
jgi:Subtilisin inhibitor-like